MPPSLPELRAQRDQIKRHLEWLDALIADAAPPPPHDPTPAVAEETAPPAPPPGASPAHSEVVAEQLLSTHAGGETILTPTAKNGCILAAMLFIILFLITLFGLPYVLYKDKTTKPAAEAGER